MTFKRRVAAWVTAVLLVGGTIVVGVGWYASGRVIHPGEKPSPYLPEEYNLLLEDVVFESRDGLQLYGWFVPGRSRSTIILVHGRGSSRAWMLPHADYLHAAGFSVLLFDFRYRGESEGEAQTLGVKESWDVESAVDYLKTRSDVDPEKVGLLGSSLGAVASILAAARTSEVKGVIAQIPFTSVNGILCHSFQHEFGLPCVPFAPVTKWISEIRLGVDLDQVAPIDVIGNISPRPVFLIDEGRDRLFPVDSVEKLYNAAKDPKEFWMVPEAGHGRARNERPDEYRRRVVAFWKRVFGVT